MTNAPSENTAISNNTENSQEKTRSPEFIALKNKVIQEVHSNTELQHTLEESLRNMSSDVLADPEKKEIVENAVEKMKQIREKFWAQISALYTDIITNISTKNE